MIKRSSNALLPIVGKHQLNFQQFLIWLVGHIDPGTGICQLEVDENEIVLFELQNAVKALCNRALMWDWQDLVRL